MAVVMQESTGNVRVKVSFMQQSLITIWPKYNRPIRQPTTPTGNPLEASCNAKAAKVPMVG